MIILLLKLHLNFYRLIINSIYVLVKSNDVFLLSKNLIYLLSASKYKN